MRRKSLIVSLLLATTFALNAGNVLACTCAAKPSVLDAYESADMVLIARVASVNKAPPSADPESYYPDNIRSVTVVVEKNYKGAMGVRNELTVQQGTGADCVWNFGEKDVGEKYLFYFKRATEAEVWTASVCGRTNRVEEAKEDLLYLDNLKKQRGKTRVSGQYRIYPGSDFSVVNKTIFIRGEEKTYETKTDDRGIFEIYDLPAGNYALEPELPTGWRLVIDRRQNPAATNSLPFTLEARKHVTFDLRLEPDTAIEGTVLGPDGNPLNGVCAYLVRRSRRDTHAGMSCTDHDGRFRFEGILPASYLLVFNVDQRISTRNPFPTMFYRNATDIGSATLIDVSAGQRLKGIDVVIPKLFEMIYVEGVLKFSDDQPAVKQPVRFKAFETAGYDGDKYALTDANGRFKLRLLKSLKGEIYADMLARSVDHENCEVISALINADGVTYLKTRPVVIDAEKDIDHLELRFPFPKCSDK